MDFLWKVRLKILNSGLILKTLTIKTLFRQRGPAGRYAFLLFEHRDGIKASHNSANP